MSSDIIVVSGPSGSGKSTLIQRLAANHDEIVFSVSHTTRRKRETEAHGKDYYFVTEEEFLRMIANREFVEWAKVYQDYYGTSMQEIRDKAGEDKYLLLDLDVQGAKNIKKRFPQALFVFIVPPSLEVLEERLSKREHGIDRGIEKRLAEARDWLAQYPLYDYIVVNDTVEEAYRVLEAIYTAYKHAAPRQEALIKSMIAEKGQGKRRQG